MLATVRFSQAFSVDKQPGPEQRGHHKAKASFYPVFLRLLASTNGSSEFPVCRGACWISLQPCLREVAELLVALEITPTIPPLPVS